MALADVVERTPGIDLKILGTDLSSKALKVAMAGRYDAQKVSGVHPRLRDRYLRTSGKGKDVVYTVCPEVKALTVFRQVNLADPPYRLRGPIDVVLCRNVMIYFDQPVRQALLSEMHRVLRPGGYLVVGHAESLSGTRVDLAPVSPSVYLRP